MDEATHKAVEQRAYELWQKAGCPEGQALLHWFRAEIELGLPRSVEAGDELVTLRELAMEAQEQEDVADGTHSLQQSVDRAVPVAERLPSGAAENPLSEHLREEAEGRPSGPGMSTLEGGNKVNT